MSGLVYDLLVWRSVLKMFPRFIFRMEQGKASKNGFQQQMFTSNIETR